jgi:hypothetical protein
MPAKSDPHTRLADSKYYYRRSASVGTVLPALGVGMMMGIAAFYVTHLFLARKPLTASGPAPSRPVRSRAPAARVRGG